MEKTITQMQAIRDLEWVMRGPSLLAGDTEGLIQDRECRGWLGQAHEALEALKRDPKPLLQFLQEKDRSGRLGNRFESLILFWLQNLMGYRPVHLGVPVREGGQTVGELDFLMAGPNGWEHWEVAVKFYMCVADTPDGARDPSSFVGQALMDRLDLKLAHLLEKQLPLARDPRARTVLTKLGANCEVGSRLLMKGRLYYPLEWDWRAISGPRAVSADHEKGWWIAWDRSGKERLRSLTLEPEAIGWSLHPKARWMAPPQGSEFGTHDELFRALDEHFSHRRAATLGITGQGIGMILQPGWPRSAVTDGMVSKTKLP